MHGVLRQVVEQRGGLVEEQRQVELDARRREAFAHAAIDARLRRVAFEARAKAAAKAAHAFRVERHFARGQQAHAVERIERALRLGVETADRLDVLVEEVDAQRVCEPIGNTSSSEPRIANSPGLVTWLTLA